jgi:MraZ protein
MTSLLGEYEVSMDAKGRFLIPSGFRKQLPEGEDTRFIISRGLNNIVTLYPEKSWEQFAAKLAKLNEFNTQASTLKRVLLGGATQVELDSAGRLLIPKPLQEFAGLKKDLVFLAVDNKVEIWDKDTYYEHIRQQSANLTELANNVFGNSFMDPFQ